MVLISDYALYRAPFREKSKDLRPFRKNPKTGRQKPVCGRKTPKRPGISVSRSWSAGIKNPRPKNAAFRHALISSIYRAIPPPGDTSYARTGDHPSKPRYERVKGDRGITRSRDRPGSPGQPRPGSPGLIRGRDHPVNRGRDHPVNRGRGYPVNRGRGYPVNRGRGYPVNRGLCIAKKECICQKNRKML